MSTKKFMTSFIAIVLLSIISVGLINYSFIKKDVLSHLPQNWSEPLTIATGDISKDFSVSFTNNQYLFAYIDGKELSIGFLSPEGDILKESRIPLHNKYIFDLEIFQSEDTIYLTYTTNIQNKSNFLVKKFDNDLNLVHDEIFPDINMSARIQDTLYAVSSDTSLKVFDISTLKFIEEIPHADISELQSITIGNESYIVYGNNTFSYYYIHYSNGSFSPETLIMDLSDNVLLTYDNLKLTEDNSNLIIVLTHLNKNEPVGEYIYRYSLTEGQVTSITDLANSIMATGNYASKIEVIRNHPEIKFIGCAKNSLGLETVSDDLVAFSFDKDGNIQEEGTINAFSDYFKYGKIVNDSMFYVKFEGTYTKSLKMTSQNELLLQENASNNDYENSIISGIFADKLAYSSLFIFLTSIVLGIGCALILGVHLVICHNSFKRDKELPRLIVALVLFGVFKLFIIYLSFYASAQRAVFLPTIFQSFLVGFIINTTMTGIVIALNIYLYKKNLNDVSYGEVFLLMLSDGILSLFLFYPTIF